MILQKEIASIAERAGVTKAVIDKDWVLGHFLAAMYSVPDIGENLVFKGGTCLRKCWFPDYRFSEDLDFTVRSENFEMTLDHLGAICEFLTVNVGILTHVASLKTLRVKNEPVGYEAIVKYWGADHPKNSAPPPAERWQTKIKVEIIRYETLVFPSIEKSLFHPYSDQLSIKQQIPCYAIEEVLSEKIRALIQRSYTAPRDYYDIWYLSNYVPDLRWESIVDAFHKKMAYKGLKFEGVDQLINPKNERAVESAWRNSLGHQVQARALPDFDSVKKYLEKLFERFFGEG